MTNEFIAEEFKGYSTFVEIDSPLLRAYNQYTVLSNMRENRLYQLMTEYIDKIGDEARLGLMVITEYIKAKGLEETKRELQVNGVFIG
jgi:hypothetical protein